jgi:hypothetical protein
MNEQLRYNKNEEPMCIPKATMDRILKVGGKNIMCDAIALYVFYYHTAKWQGQTNAKCTVSYAANGLGITEERIRRAKALLIELGLVSEFTRKNESGQVIGWYVTVNFIQNHPTEKPEGGKSQRVENPDTNALSTNNRNALSTDKNIYMQDVQDQFDRCWEMFGKKGVKGISLARFKKLSKTIRDKIEAVLPEYMAVIKAGRMQKDFQSWINQEFYYVDWKAELSRWKGEKPRDPEEEAKWEEFSEKYF